MDETIINVILPRMVEKEFSSINYTLQDIDTSHCFLRQFVWSQDEVGKPFNQITNEDTTVFFNNPIHKIKQQINTSGQVRQSIFYPHQLKPVSSCPQANTVSSSILIVSILGFSLILLAMIRYYYSKKFQLLFKAYAIFRFFNQFLRDENIFKAGYSLLLFLLFVLNVSVFSYESIAHLGTTYKYSSLGVLLFIALSIIAWFFFKLIMIQFIGFVFKRVKEAKDHQVNILMFLEITGVVLFPLALFSVFNFSAFIFYTGVVFISLMYIYFVVRFIMIQVSNFNFSLLNIFLYLCTLEILPIIIAYKVLTT